MKIVIKDENILRKFLKLPILIFLLLIIVNFKSFGQAANCAGANPFCTGTTYNFPASTNTTAQVGPDYDCLLTQPNPCWYYLQISQAGSITLSIGSPSGNDIDYCCWGPFTSFASICNNLIASTVTDCSFSTASYETCTIPNAQVGQYYMLCITNFQGTPTNIALSQTAGTGATNCNIVGNCNITSLSAVPSACNPSTNTYSVSGSITFSNPPSSGILIITDCSGNNTIFNPFFSSPLSYTISNLTANGTACNIVATFTSGTGCSDTTYYTEPPNCTPCYTPPTSFTYTTPTCYPGTSTLNYTGTATGANYMWNFDSGVAVPSTGPGPHTVTWPTDNRTYTVTLSVSIPGCDTTSATNTITVPAAIHIDSLNIAPDSCGLNLGSIVFNASGGTGNLQYTIGGVPQSTTNFENLSSGIYHIVITDNNNCTVHLNDTVRSQGALFAGFITDANQCLTGNSFSFTNTGSSNNGITYLWNFPGGNPSASNSENQSGVTWSAPGIYPIHQTMTVGTCQVDSIIDIQVYPQPIFVVSFTDVTCNGACNGTATVNPSNNSYQWDLGTGNQFTQTAINLCPGTYSVTVTNPYGCSDTGNASITEPQLLAVTTTGTGISCWGYANGKINTTVAGGTYPYTYQWSNGNVSPNLINLSANTYTVTITDANGCKVVASQTISQPYALTYTSTVTDASCAGGSDGSIILNVSYGAAPYFYMWSNSESDSSLVGIPSGNYSVTVTDFNGCTFTVPFFVFEPSPVHIMATSNTTICIGQSINLSATTTGGVGPYTYHWSTGAVQNSINVSPTTSTIYRIYSTDSHNCMSNTQPVIVSVRPPISVNVNISSHQICDGNSVVLYANASGGDGIYTYTLLNNNTIITPPYTVFPIQNEIFTIAVNDDCGSPIGQDTTSVRIYSPPQIAVTSDLVSGCQPLTVHFNESTPDYGQSYLWNFGDLLDINTSNNKNPEYTYYYEGTYTVTLTVTSAFGCASYSSFPDMISIYKNPVAKYSTDPQSGDIINPVIYFKNMSTDNVYNHWKFGDGDTSIAENPTHKYENIPHQYSIVLVVESINNCKDTVLGELDINDIYTFYAPTAFTPDGDKLNDFFVVKGNGIDPDNFKMYIFDRWGEEVFETNDMITGWDGRIKNGNKGETGEYTWLVIFKDLHGVEYKKFGRVDLIK